MFVVSVGPSNNKTIIRLVAASSWILSVFVAKHIYIKRAPIYFTELDTLQRSTYIIGFCRSLMAQTEFKSLILSVEYLEYQRENRGLVDSVRLRCRWSLVVSTNLSLILICIDE